MITNTTKFVRKRKIVIFLFIKRKKENNIRVKRSSMTTKFMGRAHPDSTLIQRKTGISFPRRYTINKFKK